MKTMQKGFTLIELMIVVAIIAILAAIAIPAYQDYTVRSKVTELVVAADACKTSVSEYFQSRGTMPSSMSASGCSAATSQYNNGITISGGGSATAATTITVAVNGTNLPQASGDNFSLVGTPGADTSKPIAWSCAATTTTIPNKYLPATCRH
ncbi:MAG TPA: pilin [Rhodanobacter sp.]|nr:pilin [Rhodanobacter sp.]